MAHHLGVVGCALLFSSTNHTHKEKHMKTDVFEEAFGPEKRQKENRTLSQSASVMRSNAGTDYSDEIGVTTADLRERVYNAGLDVMQAWTEEEPSQVPAFADVTMSKDAMITHLWDTHGYRGSVSGHAFGAHGTKATKDDLVRLHDNIHDRQARDGAEFEVKWRTRAKDGVWVRENFTLGGHPIPTVKHDHMEIELSPQTRAVRSGKTTEGVLSVQERKALTQVVDNDFGGLKQDMRAFAADQLSAKTAEIDTEWDEREKHIPNFADRATARRREYDDDKRAMEQRHADEKRAMKDAYDADFDVVVGSAKEQGVVLTSTDEREIVTDANGIRTGDRVVKVFKAAVEGRKEAKDKATAQNKQFLDRALMDLEKQRLTAQRQVLLSGVPEAALTVLESIPSAQKMMMDAAAEKDAKAIEDKSEQS